MPVPFFDMLACAKRMEEEQIRTFAEYDEKYIIHYY